MTATQIDPAPDADAPDPVAAVERRPRRRWWRAFALLPALVVLFFAVFGEALAPFDPTRIAGPPALSPGGEFWFGTDSNGLDVFSRTIAATRTNVIIASAVCAVTLAFGAALGLSIAMNESRRGPIGLAARAAARMLDLFEAVPAVVIALVVVAFYGVTRGTLVLSLCFVLTPTQARLVRTEALRVRGEAYVDSGRLGGLSYLRLVVRHVLPNSIRPALDNAPVVFGQAIILTAALGFLGVGLPPPTPEWGSMISRGASDAAVGRWWASTFPAGALLFTVAAVALPFAGAQSRRRR